MRCFECRGKCNASIVLGRSPETKENQCQKFVVYCRDELRQKWNMQRKVDASHTIAVPKCKRYSLFVFCGEVLHPLIVTDNEGKGRRMCQHVRHGRASCTKEGETQVRG